MRWKSPLNARGSLSATCMAGEKPIARSLTVSAQNRAAQEIEDIAGLLSEIFLTRIFSALYIVVREAQGYKMWTRCRLLLPSGKEVYGR